MSKPMAKKLEAIVEQKVAEAIAPSTVPGNSATVAPVTQAVMEEVGPVVDHLTNQEPWWQSRVALAALILIISRLTAQFGWAIPEELHGPITDVIIYVGPWAAVLLMGWARYFARKPLFNSLHNRWEQ